MNPFVRRLQTSAQTRRQRAEVDAVHRLLQFAQIHSFRKRIEPVAIGAKTQTEVENSFRSQKTAADGSFHPAQRAAAFHPRLQLEKDLPVMSPLAVGFKQRRR